MITIFSTSKVRNQKARKLKTGHDQFNKVEWKNYVFGFRELTLQMQKKILGYTIYDVAKKGICPQCKSKMEIKESHIVNNKLIMVFKCPVCNHTFNV